MERSVIARLPRQARTSTHSSRRHRKAACFSQEIGILDEEDAPSTSTQAEQAVRAFVDEQTRRDPNFPVPGNFKSTEYVRTWAGGSMGSINGTPIVERPEEVTGWLLVYEPDPSGYVPTWPGVVAEIAFIDYCAGQRSEDR